MSDMKIIYIIVIIILLLLIIIIPTVQNANNCCIKYHNYLTGMWIGDPQFIKKSNLTDLQIFIGPKEKKKRNGYIIMLDQNNNFILNQAIELQELSSSHNQRWSAHSANKKKIDDDFNIWLLIDNLKNVFPKKLKFSISMGNGILKIVGININGEEKTYALLTKDILASAEAIHAYSV